ncbi:MAG: lytic transglycosylase domain-containing protein, partial [Pseudomonadota bacterium]|nr:lytic transglycosylase domain-containing protein [Pseudomonadota bacterium]
MVTPPPQPACRNRDGQPTKAEMMEDSGPRRWAPLIAEAARRFAIPPAWIGQVIDAESGGHAMLDGRPITSSKGAMGLMQVMPKTYDDMRRAFGLGHDPFDPHDNILAGTAYLRAMFDRFGGGVFAAYNAGPQRYQAYLDGRQALPQETVSYLAKLDQGAPIANQQPANAVFAPSGGELFFASPGSRAHPG